MTLSLPPSHNASTSINCFHADGQKPSFEDSIQDWDTFFWLQNRFELTNHGAKLVERRLDCYQIGSIQAFTSKIKMAHDFIEVARNSDGPHEHEEIHSNDVNGLSYWDEP